MPDPIEDADLALFRRVTKWHAPVLDKILPRLTRSANKSMLWAAIAIALNQFGGKQGRRAGLRGMFAILVTAFVTNVPAKLLSRRERPLIDEVPQIRRLARLPTSTSFPSGHSSAAFAFATGVTLEMPGVGGPLLALAAMIAYSRVHVGVHYPSDVIAGAAIGAGMAVATRHFWPVTPTDAARARPAPVPIGERPDADGRGLAIVVNPSAGGIGGPSPDELRDRFPAAEILEITDELTLDDALGKAVASARAIGVWGGDGTVNAATRAALEAGKPLVVMPGGTLNHFARDIGIETLDDVSSAVREGDAVQVDVGMIDDKPFVNTASIGAYVDLVDAREHMERAVGKWPAVVVALGKVLRRAEPVYIDIDGTPLPIWMAFIGNCCYRPDGFAPSWRERLDDNVLDIRIVTANEPFARLRLLWAVLTGTASRSKIYRCEFVRGPVEVKSLRGPIRLARDGETFEGSETFRIEKSRERLVVLIPPSDESSTSSPSGGPSPRV